MASLYDILTVDEEQYYRMNKNILPKNKVPKNVLEVLNDKNVVDENGMIIVDEKVGPAKEPTEENLQEIKGKTPSKPAAGADENQNNEDDTDSVDEDNEEEDDATDDSAEDTDADHESDDEEDSDDDQEEPPKPPAPKPVKKASEKPSRIADDKPVVPVFKSKVPQSRPGMGFPRVNGKTVDIFDGKTPHTHLKLVDGVTVPLSEESFRTRNDVEIRNKLAELGVATINFSEIEAEKAAAGMPSKAGNANDMLLDEDESDDLADD